MRWYTEKCTNSFRRSQDGSQSDGKIICLKSYFPCPRGLKFNKGEKHNHSRPLNYQNIKKFIIKFTCTDPGIVSAKKDVVETFMLQLLITLFP